MLKFVPVNDPLYMDKVWDKATSGMVHIRYSNII